MSKIVKLVVAKGKSVPLDPKDSASPWLKKFYQLEIEFPEKPTEELLRRYRRLLFVPCILHLYLITGKPGKLIPK